MLGDERFSKGDDMSRDYMHFNPGDYLRDTGGLNLEQHGAYMLLIMEYFTTGKPLKEGKIPHFLRISPLIFRRKIRPFIEEFFYIIDEDWFHKRIEKEIHRVDNKAKMARDAVLARWNNRNTDVSDGVSDNVSISNMLSNNLNKESSLLDGKIAPAKAPDSEIFLRLNEAAAGNVSETAFIRPILDLISMGCDFEKHILPAIRASVPKLKTPLKSWGCAWLRDEILSRAKSIPKAAPSEPPAEMVTFLNGQKYHKWRILKNIDDWNAGKGWGLYGETKPFARDCQIPPEYLSMCRKSEEFSTVSCYDLEDQA
jgi:uncharacterized protein YdaU (DUF1376 family)